MIAKITVTTTAGKLTCHKRTKHHDRSAEAMWPELSYRNPVEEQ